MNCFIIRADGNGLKNVKVIDYNFPLDLQHAGSASIVGNYVGYEDGIMICVPLNYGWRIATCSPSMAEEKTTVKLESILTFFDREISTDGLQTTEEDIFLNGAIGLFKTDGDDYLKLNNIESSISSGLDYSPPKVTEYGTFNLKTYINDLIDSNYLKLTVSIYSDGKKLELCEVSATPKKVIINRGNNFLTDETQTKNAISAITNYEKDENDEYTSTTYYLFTDGTFDTDPLSGERLRGKWAVMHDATIQEIEQKFSGNEYAHKIGFKDAILLCERQKLTLLMPDGRLIQTVVTGITASDKENVFTYECGNLKTKLTDFIGGLLNV